VVAVFLGKASYKAKYTKQAEDIRESVRVLKEKLTEVLENRSEQRQKLQRLFVFVLMGKGNIQLPFPTDADALHHVNERPTV